MSPSEPFKKLQYIPSEIIHITRMYPLEYIKTMYPVRKHVHSYSVSSLEQLIVTFYAAKKN